MHTYELSGVQHCMVLTQSTRTHSLTHSLTHPHCTLAFCRRCLPESRGQQRRNFQRRGLMAITLYSTQTWFPSPFHSHPLTLVPSPSSSSSRPQPLTSHPHPLNLYSTITLLPLTLTLSSPHPRPHPLLHPHPHPLMPSPSPSSKFAPSHLDVRSKIMIFYCNF